MRILIADQLPAEVRIELSKLGLEVDFQPQLTADEIVGAIVGAHVLVVRSTRVTAAALDAGDRLQLVIRAGAGTNTIDCERAAHRAVFVANCPGKNAIAVAELTLGLILSLDRRIPDNVSELRAGHWRKSRFGKANGLYGRTLGIIGLGRIGEEVLARAKAFGLNCIAWSRSLTPERAAALGVEYSDTVLELVSRADIVSLHVAHAPETHHLIGANELAAMKQGAFLVNMARGGVVDDAALAHAVAAGRIRAAADVYEDEPKDGEADFDGVLRDGADFYGTHHIGASTAQAQSAIAAEVCAILEAYVATGVVNNCVNLSPEPPATGQLLVRHLDRVGVLAGVLDVLKCADINVQGMQNTIFDGAVAACATMALEQAPSATVIAKVAAIEHVLGVEYLPV